MANTPVVVMDDTLTGIADAIRGKTGSQATMNPGQMAAQISSIPVGSLGIPREIIFDGFYGAPYQEFAFALPADVDMIAEGALAYAFYSNLQPKCGITSISLSNVVTVNSYGCINMCHGCDKLLTADCGKVMNVMGASVFEGAFRNCSALKSADFSSLMAIAEAGAFTDAFNGCSSLSSVNFNSLSIMFGSMAFCRAFAHCTSLTSISFPALVNFGPHTDPFRDMLTGVTGCTVHFPAAIQPLIGDWPDVTNGFGGTNTTVLFDL